MNKIGIVPIAVAAAFLWAHAGQVIAQDQPKRTWLAGIDPVVAAIGKGSA